MRPDLDLRAALDTRGAAILLTLSLLALAGTAALGGLLQPSLMEGRTSDVELTVVLMTLPLALILPAVIVPVVAGEWSDRSIQNTFLQRPGRAGVLGSKTLTALVLAAGIVLVTVLLALGATWVGGELLGEGAILSTLDGVLTTQLAVLGATVLLSLSMGILLQSTVLGIVAAIGIPFVVSTAGTLAVAFGSETLAEIVRALDLTAAAVALAEGRAGVFELLPLVLLVLLPAVLGTRRWMRREIA